MNVHQRGNFHVAEENGIAMFGADGTLPESLVTSPPRLNTRFHTSLNWPIYWSCPEDVRDEKMAVYHTEPPYGTFTVKRYHTGNGYLLFSTPQPMVAFPFLDEMVEAVGMELAEPRSTSETVAEIETLFPVIRGVYSRLRGTWTGLPQDLNCAIGGLAVFLTANYDMPKDDAAKRAFLGFRKKISAANNPEAGLP